MNTEGNQTGGASRRRGFAAMDPTRQREIASRGGHAAHSKGKAHEFSTEEAREAGRKGGQSVSRDRAHMARIGREGGKRSHRKPPASEPPKPPADDEVTPSS
jgi:general stress protein YciG